MKKSICLIVVSCLTIISAQQLQVAAGQPDLSNFPDVCIDVTVSDSSGQVVSGLTTEMLTIYEDSIQNKNYGLSSLRDSDNKLSILVAVDASLSMRGDPINNVKSSLRNFINQLSNDDQLSILTFHDGVDIISDFSSNKDTLLSSVDSIKAVGKKTELYYGIFSGLKQLSENDTINDDKILIVLSDGKDEPKVVAYTDNDCIEKAKEESIPIYSIGFHSKAEEKYLRLLERISDKTGGVYNDVKTANKLNMIYEKVFNQIQGRYSLCFTSINTQNDSIDHMVTLIVNNGNSSGETQFVLNAPTTEKRNLLVAGVVVLLIIVIASIVVMRNRRAEEEEKARIAAEQKRLELEGDEEENVEDEPSSEVPTEIHASNDPRETVIAGHSSFQPLQFLFESGPLKGNNQTIDGNINIGRGKGNNLILDEKTVSSNHCKISVEHGDFFIEDLKSTNGTKVNGARIEKAKIKSGDRIEMGAVIISVR